MLQNAGSLDVFALHRKFGSGKLSSGLSGNFANQSTSEIFALGRTLIGKSGFTPTSGGTIVESVFSTGFEIRHLFVSEGHNFVGHHQKSPGTHTMTEVPQIVCIAGKGIVGDRYFGFRDNYKGQITFFEQEVHEELCAQFGVWDRGPEVYRRNVITRGVRLNDLIGAEFKLQGVCFFGKEECRPCYWMDFAFSSGVENMLKGRGGLRAEILSDGHLRRTEA